MADLADVAAAIEAERIANGLRKIAPDLPPGVAGECDECGEFMPRLIDGRCGFCRDGRRPPLSFYDERATAPSQPASTQKEHVTMATAAPAITGRKIEFTGDAQAAIERRAEAGGIPFKQAAAELVAIATRALAGAADAAAPEPTDFDGSKPSAIVFLGNVPDVWLIEELARRISGGVSTDDHDAAIARAEAAEGQLATIKSVLADAQ